MSQIFIAPSIAQQEPLPSISQTSQPLASTITPSKSTALPARSVAFVDAGLSQVDQLIAGIETDKVVLVHADSNGIEQITQTLTQYNNLSSIHIFSHGSPGALQLGNTILSADSFNRDSRQLSQWGNALLGEADLMLYACNFTSTKSGLELAKQIGHATGADVAASDDTTGASRLGGDWQLETRIGEIENAIALDSPTRATYTSTLELLTNGDFEADLSNWARFNGSETTTTAGALDSKSVRVRGANGGIGQTVTATAGEAYKLEGFARSSATNGYTGIGINFLDDNRNVIGNIGRSITTNEWTAYELEGIADEGTQFIQVWAYKEANSGSLFLDNLVLSPATITPPEPPTPSGPELLTNPGFEAGLSSWGTFSGTETISTTAFAGDRSLQLSAATSGAGQVVDANAGEEFTFSLYGRTTNTGYVGAGLNFFDANYNLLAANFSNEIDINGNRWQPYQQTSIAPAQTRFVQTWLYQDNASGNTFLDEISLSRREDDPVVDTAAPTATLSADDLTTAGLNSYDFTVTYTDETAVDVASLDDNDIIVKGPNGYRQRAILLSATPNSDGTPRTGTYRLPPPLPDGWTTINNGTYTIRLRGKEIADTLGNQNQTGQNLGTFAVDIEPDSSNFGNIQIQDSSIAVSEAAGTATVTVTRTDGSDGVVTVDYGITNVSATPNEDFTPVDGTLTFADGETEKEITINILDDDIEEDPEAFSVAIDNVRGGATLLVPRTATITIQDNDREDKQVSRYRLTTGLKTWEEAQAEAVSLGGNLVTINDAAEERRLKDTFGASEAFWIGLTDREAEGSFEWVSGEAVVYTNWASEEPNDFGTGEDYAQMNFGSNRQWNDLGATATRRGIIEIKSDPAEVGDGNGLLGEYYNNIDFTDPEVTRTDSTVDFNWGNGSPDPAIDNDTFSVRWSGRIEPLYSETYTFQTTSDDGVRLFIDNELVIDKFIDQGPTAHRGIIALEAGEQYDIRMEYYERGGGAVAELAWFSPSQPLQVVPQTQLYSDEPSDPDIVVVGDPIVTGLTRPTSIEWQPNTDRMFISEKAGIVKIFEDGILREEPFIDISDQVNGRRDRGLLDIAIHPNFPSTPYVYLLYTYDPPEVFDNLGTQAGPDGVNNRAGRLTRVTADASTNYTTAVEGSEVVLVGKNSTWDNFDGTVNSTFNFDVPQAGLLEDGSYLDDILVADSESHTVGGLSFGPDGALYFTNGDGASYNRTDPRATRVQDIDSLSGKVLRIDPITGEGLADNPFFNGDPNANRSKVWQYGLRNPFRITIDEDTGDLYIGDVGLSTWEEINSAEAGANFGWPYYEGGDTESLPTIGYQNLPEAIAFYNSDETATVPLKGFSRSEFGINAIVLGDIYTGTVYPEKYRGDLFFNDLGQGIVRNASLNVNGEINDIQTFATGANVVVHIEQGPDGFLYYTDLDDGVIGRWVFSTSEDIVIGDDAFVPDSLPPTAKLPPSTPRGKQPNQPDFFLAP